MMFIVILTDDEGHVSDVFRASSIGLAKKSVYMLWCEEYERLEIWTGPEAGHLSCVSVWDYDRQKWFDVEDTDNEPTSEYKEGE